MFQSVVIFRIVSEITLVFAGKEILDLFRNFSFQEFTALHA
jgi:hypothetical protein